MLKRLVKWNYDRRAWKREHELAWSGQDEPNEAGISLFQTKCEAAVTSALLPSGVELIDRTIEGEQERVIRARISGTGWTIWIYLDGAQVSSETATLIRLEQWDTKSPDELIDKLVASLTSSARANR
jgi:hypothetical protein